MVPDISEKKKKRQKKGRNKNKIGKVSVKFSAAAINVQPPENLICCSQLSVLIAFQGTPFHSTVQEVDKKNTNEKQSL